MIPVIAGQIGDIMVYEINGELCMSSVDLGKALGFSDPAPSIRQIYDRHKDELEEYRFLPQFDTKPPDRVSPQFEEKPSGKNKGGRPPFFYTEEGIYMICMFAETPIAKEIRIKIARLLKSIRLHRVYNFTAQLAEKNEELVGAYRSLAETQRALMAATAKKPAKKMTDEAFMVLVDLKRQGYETHQIRKKTGWSDSTVKKYIAKARRLGLLSPRALAPTE